jgi:hypothetical protein
MLIAEKRTTSEDPELNVPTSLEASSDNRQSSWLNAILSILTLIITVILGILLTGQGSTL